MTEYSNITRLYPGAPLIGVGALIVDDGRIVLVKRGTPPSKGEWSIPGGLVELGEPLVDAVAREAREETGLIVEPGPLIELLDRIFPDKEGRIRYHYVLADYLCRVIDGTLRASSDAAAARWMDREELDTIDLAPVTRRVAVKAMEHEAALRRSVT